MRASTARRGSFPFTNASAPVGELAFWLALIAALSLTILALARPQGITAIVRSPGVDIVLLMDGSTSMRVRDMGTDRWQRAMQWVRTLTKTLSWNGDRMALATFADIAVPQVRLTRDPNTILFFLDHLDDAPTFRLENETSWNTNVEDAIYWGVKLVETDQEMYGPSKNARTFVVISDGQVWSGNVQRAIAAAAQPRHFGRRDWRRHVERRHDSAAARRQRGGAGGIRSDSFDHRSHVAARDRARRQRRVFRDRHRRRRADRGAHHSERGAPLGQRAGRTRRSTSCTGICSPPPRAASAVGVLFVKQRLQLGFGFAVALALLALISSLRS